MFKVTKIKDVLLAVRKRPKISIPTTPLDEAGVVYKLTCTKCPKGKSFYVGETGRSLNKRQTEHFCNYSKLKTRSPIFQHSLTQHGACHKNDWTVEIFARQTDGLKHKISEAQFIRTLNPTLNLNSQISHVR